MRSLVKRELTFWGGYGVQSSPCSNDTSTCGDGCCPAAYKCASVGDHKTSWSVVPTICCPTDVDCSANVVIVPACANTSWGFYHAYSDFCCPPNFVGIYPAEGVLCLSNSLPIPADRLASSVKQATTTKGIVATTGGPASKGAGTTTPTTSASAGVITSSSDSQSTPAGTTNNSSQSGLSHGATIAIAVLAAVLGLLLLLAAGYFWRKKRLSNKKIPSSLNPPTNTQPAAAKTPAFHGNELLGKSIVRPETTELETPARAELYDTSRA